MFVRRGRRVYLRTAPAGSEPISDEPIPPAVAPTPTPAPVVAADAPKFDPESPEVKAHLDKLLAAERKRIATEEGGKARDTARASERAATLATIAEALGLKPAEVDPAKIAEELTQARAEAKSLRIGKAVEDAARSVKADGEIVAALLASKGRLADLDPAGADFEDKVKALVGELVKSNPRVLLETTTPAGGQAPVNGGFNGQPTAGQWPSMQAALAERLGTK